MEIFGYPLEIVLFICAGVFLASFVDSIGGGGGLISVPVYLLSGLPAHLALGTNKMSACIGTVVSTGRFIKNGFINWSLAPGCVALALIGSHFGTRLQLAMDDHLLKLILLCCLPVIAFVILRQKALPEEPGHISPRRQKAIMWIAALLIGAYDGLYGPGTGTFLLLVGCNLARMDVRTSSGTAKLINLSSNISSLVTSLAAGTVLVPIGLIAAVFSIAGHYIGAGLTLKNGSKVVRPVILVVLLLLTIKVISELF